MLFKYSLFNYVQDIQLISASRLWHTYFYLFHLIVWWYLWEKKICRKKYCIFWCIFPVENSKMWSSRVWFLKFCLVREVLRDLSFSYTYSVYLAYCLTGIKYVSKQRNNICTVLFPMGNLSLLHYNTNKIKNRIWN
jgi:hypothetical protein